MIPFNYLLHYSHLFRIRERRKQTKNLVDSENYSQALNSLNEILEEQSNFYTDELIEQRKDFQYGEKIQIEQARNHLEQIVIGDNNPNYYAVDRETNTYQIKPHSEKVKQILNNTPKTSYLPS